MNHSKSWHSLPSSLRFVWTKFRKATTLIFIFGLFVGATIAFFVADPPW